MNAQKTLVGKIDCTPPWESLAVQLAESSANGNMDAQAELLRMAMLADSVKSLRASNADLLVSLRPLAALAPAIKDDMSDDSAIITARGGVYAALGIEGTTLVSVGDVRRAVAAIAKAEGAQ